MSRTILKFESPSEIHDPLWINLVLNSAKPRQIPTIHVFQRSIEKRIVDIHCRVCQVLPICNCNIMDRLCTVAQHISHRLVKRGISPQDGEDGREDSSRTVRRVRRWAPMREEATVEGFKHRAQERSAVKSRNSLPPELRTPVILLNRRTARV